MCIATLPAGAGYGASVATHLSRLGTVLQNVPFSAPHHHPAILASFPAIRVRDRHLVIENTGKPCGARFLTVRDPIQPRLARSPPILTLPGLHRRPEARGDVRVVLLKRRDVAVPQQVAGHQGRATGQDELACRRRPEVLGDDAPPRANNR